MVNMDSACTLEEALFVSLDNFAKISILLDKDNDLEEQITHLSDEVNIFILNLKKMKHNQRALNILKTCTVIQGNFERFQVCFPV